MDLSLIGAVANYGFAAVMAVIMFMIYRKDGLTHEAHIKELITNYEARLASITSAHASEIRDLHAIHNKQVSDMYERLTLYSSAVTQTLQANTNALINLKNAVESTASIATLRKQLEKLARDRGR